MAHRPITTIALLSTALGVVVAAPSAAHAEPADVAAGVVFSDLNENGQRNVGEVGVAGVRVSNGVDVVVTDADGSYELSVDDQTTIFISKPSGWMVPVDDQMLPQFYYHHFPNGSPHQLRYGGVEPTGPLPDSVDFPLTAQPEAATFSPLVLADPQTRNTGEIADFEVDVLDGLQGTTAPFGLTVGDIVNNPLDLYPAHNEAVAELGVPWWNLPGNHDMDYDAPSDTNATDTYKQVFGPTNYSFDYGEVHFIALDNVEKLGATRRYRGYLNDQQLQWIENDLAHVPDDKLVVIATHIPLKNGATDNPGGNTARLGELLDLVEDREHLYTFSGHRTGNSWQSYLGPEDGWDGDEPLLHQILAEARGGGWTTGPADERGVQQADMADGNPNGSYTITFDGVDYAPQFKPASLPADFLTRISYRSGDQTYLPGGRSGSGDFAEPVSWHRRDFDDDRGTRPVVEVNVFDGGERNVVEMSIDGRDFTPMQHSTPTNDPYITELYQTYRGTPQAPARPTPSSHIWTAPLPTNLAPGKHNVIVRNTSAWGQVNEQTSKFTITTSKP